MAESEGLSESDLDPNPFQQFEKWFAEARSVQALAEAMALATATTSGVPSVRMVLLKGIDDHGVVFYTNYESPKGHDLAENPRAAAVMYWPELGRQVRINGDVSRVSKEESEAYFRSRPIESRLSAWASRQSEVIAGRGVLEQRMGQLAEEYAGHAVPLPPFWGGYRLTPHSFEFWMHRDNRLHDRFRYRRAASGWTIERLSP